MIERCLGSSALAAHRRQKRHQPRIERVRPLAIPIHRRPRAILGQTTHHDPSRSSGSASRSSLSYVTHSCITLDNTIYFALIYQRLANNWLGSSNPGAPVKDCR